MITLATPACCFNGLEQIDARSIKISANFLRKTHIVLRSCRSKTC